MRAQKKVLSRHRVYMGTTGPVSAPGPGPGRPDRRRQQPGPAGDIRLDDNTSQKGGDLTRESVARVLSQMQYGRDYINPVLVFLQTTRGGY